jgi:4-hydroxy-tetrahydrodipicolinate reductase
MIGIGGTSAMTPIKICVVGADGKMGSAVIREASKNFQVVGAVTIPNSENVGKTLGQLGLSPADLEIVSQQYLDQALKNADIYISFTAPSAELVNVPVAARMSKKVVMGTTGFTDDQMRTIRETLTGKVPAVISPNFSIGMNILFKTLEMCRMFPDGFDFSVVEAHHLAKADAPSGTAKKIGDILSAVRGYSERVYGREGMSKRREGQLELLSVRAGGIPGIHDVIIAGQHEMIRIEHIAFSRSVFAQGALYAAEWLNKQSNPTVYTMEDVLRK